MESTVFELHARDLTMRELGNRVPKLASLAAADGWFKMVETPAGAVQTLALRNRADFEFAIRALFHKGEPAPIPASMGATFVNGLWDRPKIEAFVETFADENEGMAAVMADKANFKTQMVILSEGPYSAVPAEDAGMGAEEWCEKSLAIRLYHELAHHVCRMRYAQYIDALRDEVVADMSGLLGAFGHYDTALALRFLGVEADAGADGPAIREGGRLLNYLEEDGDEAAAAARVRTMVAQVAQLVERHYDERGGGNALDLVASPAFQEALAAI